MAVKTADDLSGYKFANDGTNVTLTAFSDPDATEIILPAYVGGAPLRKIGFSAFRGCDHLTGVTLPDTVQSIDNSAFRGCQSLVRMTAGKELRFIEQYAFAGCKNLKEVTFPSTLKKIGEKTFYGCTEFTELHVLDMHRGVGDTSKHFVIASHNENRRWGYLNASLIYFDSYNMQKYDEGYAVIHGFDDLYNIAQYRLVEDEQLDPYMRRIYENNIRMSIPHLIEEDQIGRLASAGELGLIEENRMDSYLETASRIQGRCVAYLLDYKEHHFKKRERTFEL